MTTTAGRATWPTGSERSLMIDLRLPGRSVQSLAEEGYRLCLFRAAECDLLGGTPLVWAAGTVGTPALTLAWNETGHAYVSHDVAAPGAEVRATSLRRLVPGQVMAVGPHATAAVDARPGHPRYVTAVNSSSTPLTCGLAAPTPLGAAPAGDAARGVPSPYCAFPLHGRNMVFLRPLPRIALCFTSLPLAAGTAVQHLPGPTVLVDLTGRDHLALSYDIDGGWSWRGPYVTPVPLGGLTRSLVIPSYWGPACAAVWRSK